MKPQSRTGSNPVFAHHQIPKCLAITRSPERASMRVIFDHFRR
jgi:hypothetical protein